MFTLAEIIDLAIRIEKNGEKAYRKARDGVSNPSLASMLQRLAEEESEHGKWFAGLKEKVETRVEDPRLEEMGKTLLQGVLGDQTFSIDDADFSRIKDLEGLLELSVEFEKDTILFYEMLSAFIQDENILDQLDLIIEEENRHVRLLEGCLQKRENLTLGTFCVTKP
jgi:rubrerythrin